MKITSSLLLACALSSGCASIYSRKADSTDTASDGLTYYAPKQDFLVTVTISTKDDEPKVVSVTPSGAYPDYEHRFVLTHGSGAFVSNESKVTVTPNGLLKSTKSLTTSQVPAILDSIVSSVATGTKLFSQKGTVDGKPIDDCRPGTHVFRVRPGQGLPADLACGFTISTQPLAAPERGQDDIGSIDRPGVYYRVPLPYLIQVRGDLNHDAILLSPNDSRIRFLPIARTFFAKNDAEFSFVDGIPEKYDQNRESELVALLKLPASIIGSYFSAIGKVFESFTAKDSAEVSALAASTNIEIAKMKYNMCLKAIETNDLDTVERLQCGK